MCVCVCVLVNAQYVYVGTTLDSQESSSMGACGHTLLNGPTALWTSETH